MSKLTEVLAAHRWSPSIAAMASYSAGGCFGCMFHGNYDQFVAHVEEAIAAAGLVVVDTRLWQAAIRAAEAVSEVCSGYEQEGMTK